MEDLTSLIPVIKRARGYRLYALSGRRYLDLSLSGGHNLLGHKPPSYINNLKQVCEKGLLSDLPSIYGKRFLKSLRVFFPEYKTFLAASSLSELLAKASPLLEKSYSPADIHDPLLSINTKGSIAVWRPFFSGNQQSDLLLPVIPTGLGPVLFVLCSRQAVFPDSLPHFSPLILSAAVYALSRLRTLTLPEYHKPDLLSSSRLFEQKDIYLVPRCPASQYRHVFSRFLEGGVVLPAHYPHPAILPFELSPGELKNLLTLFDNEQEGEKR